MKGALILGGYGNFGKRIATALAKAKIPITIAGRNTDNATFASIKSSHPHCDIEQATFDANTELGKQLQQLKPAVVINTIGPFQTSSYGIAECCIEHKVHYIDLADGRDFVTGIQTLDSKAKEANIAVISGASTIPGLSSAVMEKYREQFHQIDSLTYGISPGQKAERGLATTAGILTYIGRPLKPPHNSSHIRYGWQDLYRQEYPELGTRWMANCDIPDLDLFPPRYGIKEIRFSAGMESALLHLSIWAASWLVRIRPTTNLAKHAALLLRTSHLFDRLGTADGGMHMIIKGKDKNQAPHTVKWFIIAKDGDGPQIPTIPAIILAKKITSNDLNYTGATPCTGMVTLQDYMTELQEYSIKTYTTHHP